MKRTKKIILSVSGFLVLGSAIAFPIISPNSFSWGEGIGWVNWLTTNGIAVDVTNTTITGEVWSQDYGWINLSPTNGGVTNTCTGNVGGFAWGERIGYIDMSGVSIDPTTGIFSGTGTTDSLGRVQFGGTNFALETSWRCDPSAMIDDDGDGFLDVIEVAAGSDPDNAGSIPADTDGDGFPDAVETAAGSDPAVATSVPVDTDGDGFPDFYETDIAVPATDPANVNEFPEDPSPLGVDTDGDGFPDWLEVAAGSDPGLASSVPADTDGDGVPDVVELSQGTSVTDPLDYQDADGDLVPDYVESQQEGTDATDPTVGGFLDTDNDGVPDYVESIRQANDGGVVTNPNDGTDFTDTDGGGTPDYVEVTLFVNEGLSGTDPTDSSDDARDTDGDTFSDYLELLGGSNPSEVASTTADIDGDGNIDSNEDLGTNGGDGNGDGILDSQQVNVSGVPNATTGTNTTLEAAGACAVFSENAVVVESSLSSADITFDYPFGLLDFQVRCAAPGESVTITVHYATVHDTSDWVWRKFDSLGSVYATIDDLVIYGTATVGSTLVTTATFTITDGDPRTDEDGIANGVIDDPSGPGIIVPTVNAGGGAPKNYPILVTDKETGACVNVIPHRKLSTDSTYEDFTTCVSKSASKTGSQCAQEWAVANSYQSCSGEFGSTPSTEAKVPEIVAEATGNTCEEIAFYRYPERRNTGVADNLFKDTLETAVTYPYLIDLAEQGIVNGDANTGFARLEDNISRAEVVKIMTIARQDVLQKGDCVKLTKFPDVEINGWYHDFVQNLEYQDIVHGYKDGLYWPQKSINKAEIYKILAISFDFTTKTEADKQSRERGVEWYVPYVEALESNVSLPQYIAQAPADRIMTRGEVFELLSKVLRVVDGI